MRHQHPPARPVPERLDALRQVDWERRLRDPSGDTTLVSFTSGLLLGAVVGLIVALLLAQRPGRETRALVRQTGIRLRSAAQDPLVPRDITV